MTALKGALREQRGALRENTKGAKESIGGAGSIGAACRGAARESLK